MTGFLEGLSGGKKEKTEMTDEERREAKKKFTFIRGGRKTNDPKIEHIVERNSVIREGKIFTRDEVLKLIYETANKEGFREDELRIVREVYDAQNNLLALDAEVKDERARAEGWGRIIYAYKIKGNHGSGGAAHTGIVRVYGHRDNPEEIVTGGVVAQYQNGGWRLTPNVIASENAIDIKPIE